MLLYDHVSIYNNARSRADELKILYNFTLALAKSKKSTEHRFLAIFLFAFI